ncbi:MAG: uroporphyrinogen-III synthase [Bacteroidota bacterium]
MTSPRKIVWLLRTPERPDPYESVLREAGYDALSIPVLRFERCNDRTVRGRLARPDEFGGAIITSPRAAEILLDVLSAVDDACARAWMVKPTYAVGPRTAGILSEAGLEVSDGDAGTGRALADLIFVSYRDDRPLLFLAGNRRRNELPDELIEAGVPFEEVTLYRTIPESLPEMSTEPDWIALFSPTGVEALATNKAAMARAHLAAIGPTTAAAIRAAGLIVSAEAERPNPPSLRDAIMAADGEPLT